MDKSQIIKVLSNHKDILRKQFNILKIGLFGSYSTNSQNKDSDIDLVYQLEEGTYLGIKELFELELFFKNLFNISKIDLVNKKYINPIIENEMNKTVIYV